MSRFSCACCTDCSGSPLKIANLLRGRQEPCEDCSEKKTIVAMIQQFRSKRPQWWVVDGALIVPIWILERLKHDLNRIG